MMCEECEDFPVRYVAYFNKPGGKLWRPSQKTAGARPLEIDGTSGASPFLAAGAFTCVEVPGGVPSPTGFDARGVARPVPEP
jgi:hypothetical protein